MPGPWTQNKHETLLAETPEPVCGYLEGLRLDLPGGLRGQSETEGSRSREAGSDMLCGRV